MRNMFSVAMALIMIVQAWSLKSSSSPTEPASGNPNIVAVSESNSLSQEVSNSSSFPTTGIIDNFNRANGTIGTNWSIDRSQFMITGNQMGVSSDGMILWNPTSFGPDQEAYVTFVNVDDSATNMDLLLKSQDSERKINLLEVSYNPAGKTLIIASYTSGKGYTEYCENIPATFANGDQFGARASADGKVYVYKNGVSLAVCDVSSWPSHSQGGYVGLLAWGAPNAIFDNFGGGTTAGTAPQVPSATTKPLPTRTRANTRTATVTKTPRPDSTTVIVSAPTGTKVPTKLATNTVAPTTVIQNIPSATVTLTPVPSATVIKANTPTSTAVPTIVTANTLTPTTTTRSLPTATVTQTPLPTATATKVYTPNFTNTSVSTATSYFSPTPTITKSPVPSATRSNTPTATSTFTLTPTPTSLATTVPTVPSVNSFLFASLGDPQEGSADLLTASNRIASFNPSIVIFNGDLMDSSTTVSEMTSKTNSFKTAGIFDKTFFVRGNHDAESSGDITTWENFFSTSPNIKVLPAGVTNYVAINNSSYYLTYSFEYGNSMFIGIDSPGDADLITSGEYTFMDARLAYAESIGLTHAFIYFHGGEYPIESNHSNCSAKADGSCTPASFVTLINKHPIVSATFHGHEHIQAWIHMDSTRVSGIIHPYEEFFTSPASTDNSYNPYIYPNRVDYYDTHTGIAFATVSVDGNSFTVNFYRVGIIAPVWSKTFTKGTVSALNTQIATATLSTPVPTQTKTSTRTPTATPTITKTLQFTYTPTITPAITNTPANPPAAGTRIQKYYMVDRVINNSDFAELAGWGINTAMVDFDVNGDAATWRAVFTEAAKYNINIVIWPSDWNNPRPNCDWEAPYPVSANGDITKVKPLLDVATQYANFIGIINAHESFWTCTNMTFNEMAGLKTQLKAYASSKGRDIKVWNYINGLYNESMLPTSQISRIMDVAIIWKHCAGNVEGYCDYGNDSALAQIISDRARLTSAGLDGKVDLVYIIQTFTTGSGYTTKFYLPQLTYYSCEFLNTSALDGFGYYTWDAGWWADLHSWTDLQPAIPYVHDNCIRSAP